ncbi:hypothetical protein [Azospirillum sp. INR13]|uniref:hypothetical protein n=1 Tax=Azospirillum sp. INR13 TaxID=2596919 RepID=UPI00210449B6|nr:hypothetical protein [Azospirillum sp. INR13]
MTQALVDGLSPDLRDRTKPLNNVAMKGKTAPIRVHRVRSADDADDAIESTTLGFSMVTEAGDAMVTLHLSYRDRKSR